MKVTLSDEKKPTTITDKGDGVHFKFYDTTVLITIGNRRLEVDKEQFRKLIYLT